MEITRLSNTESDMGPLIDLLVDCVGNGASIGFLPLLLREEAKDYWDSLNSDLSGGKHVLLVARSSDTIVGAVQASFCLKKNGLHRAEIEKLMVLQNFRRQGLGKLLLNGVEEAARIAGRWLLVLDTRVGDVASELYHSAGYTVAGIIPNFALNAHGTYDATRIFYKKITVHI